MCPGLFGISLSLCSVVTSSTNIRGWSLSSLVGWIGVVCLMYGDGLQRSSMLILCRYDSQGIISFEPRLSGIS
jgi:hypothetical protein